MPDLDGSSNSHRPVANAAPLNVESAAGHDRPGKAPSRTFRDKRELLATSPGVERPLRNVEAVLSEAPLEPPASTRAHSKRPST